MSPNLKYDITSSPVIQRVAVGIVQIYHIIQVQTGWI